MTQDLFTNAAAVYGTGQLLIVLFWGAILLYRYATRRPVFLTMTYFGVQAFFMHLSGFWQIF